MERGMEGELEVGMERGMEGEQEGGWRGGEMVPGEEKQLKKENSSGGRLSGRLQIGCP